MTSLIFGFTNFVLILLIYILGQFMLSTIITLFHFCETYLFLLPHFLKLPKHLGIFFFLIWAFLAFILCYFFVLLFFLHSFFCSYREKTENSLHTLVVAGIFIFFFKLPRVKSKKTVDGTFIIREELNRKIINFISSNFRKFY